MTKTQRRRVARQRAADAASSSAGIPQDFDAAIGLLNDDGQWQHFASVLHGLLAVEFTSPFIDAETWCPEHAHLVAQLDLLRDPGEPTVEEQGLNPYEQSVPDLERRAVQALEVIATLCAAAQYLSRDEELYSRFWRRVAESSMLETPLDPSAIDTWTRFTKARGIRLLVSWSRKPFEPSQLFDPLRDFLKTPRPSGCETVSMPVTIGLRFVRAALTPSVLRSLHELLIMPSGKADSLLVDPSCLHMLWFDSIELETAELIVVAGMLADPRMRRVDALTIETLDVEQLVELEPGFADAFCSVLTSIFGGRNENQPRKQAFPVAISLPFTSFDAERLDAFREIITTGVRPLSSLSLPNVRLRTEAAFKSLAALVFKPLPNLTPGATLDLSMLENRVMNGLGLLARDAIEGFWATGEIREGKIECVFNGGPLHHRPHGKKLDASVSASRFHAIEDFHPATKFVKISVPATHANGASASVSGWVLSTMITQLRCDGVDVIGSSFSRLIFDPAYYDRTSSRTILHLASAMGCQLNSLALRGHCALADRLSAMASSLPDILSRCPRLEELSLAGSQLTMDDSLPFWADPACELPTSLAVLSLGHCGLRDLSLEGLQPLPLRYLSLPGNPVGSVGVESLLGLLESQPSLAFVELTPQVSDPPTRCVQLRAQIDALLDQDYLHAREKAAVLSVLLDIQRRNRHLPYPGNDVVAATFAFAGTKPRRAVKWVRQ